MTEKGGAPAETDAIRAKSGVGSGSVEPLVSYEDEQYQLVEWRQTNLEEYYDQYIDTMDKAIALGRQLKEVGERCEIAIGKLANHVEKGKWGGGISAFARGIGLPFSTVQEWATSTKTPELTAAAVILGTKKVAVIERAPDEVKEVIWEWIETQESEPSHKDIKDKIREVEIESLPDPEPRNDIVCDSIENILDYIEPESVDLILTDPPYPEEYLSLWGVLAEKAAVLLKPGGILIAYSGQAHLPEVLRQVSEHLMYVWTFALLLKGPHSSYFPCNVFVNWKPLLFLVKPPYTPRHDWIVDPIKGGFREKSLHEWQQSLSEAEELITRFTHKKALVVDPFLGSGTTVLAAQNTGRNFFGMDIDELAIKTTLGRLAT